MAQASQVPEATRVHACCLLAALRVSGSGPSTDHFASAMSKGLRRPLARSCSGAAKVKRREASAGACRRRLSSCLGRTAMRMARRRRRAGGLSPRKGHRFEDIFAEEELFALVAVWATQGSLQSLGMTSRTWLDRAYRLAPDTWATVDMATWPFLVREVRVDISQKNEKCTNIRQPWS